MSVNDLSDLFAMLGLVVGCAFVISVVGALVRIIWISVCENDR